MKVILWAFIVMKLGKKELIITHNSRKGLSNYPLVLSSLKAKANGLWDF